MRNTATAIQFQGMSTKSEVDALLALVAAGDESSVPVLEDAILSGVVGAGKTVYLMPTHKAWKRQGHVHPERRIPNAFAVIEPGKSIRLVGIEWRDGKRVGIDRTFKIGDAAEHSSFNLSYYGDIRSISAKRIVIRERDEKHARSLEIADFYSRNQDFDLATAFARNHEVMTYL